MAIQDFSIELTRGQSLAVGASGYLPYIFGNNPLSIASLQNSFCDVGQGAELCVEFEVTTAFTGYVGSAQIPHLIMGVAVATDTSFAFNTSAVRMLSMVGWNFGPSGVEFGMQPSDSQVVPALRKGDRYYCKLPGGVLGLPYIGIAGTLNTYTIPSSAYINAMFILPMCTGQAAQLAPAAIWTATNFTAGAITARLTIGQQTTDGIHHYAKGMVVK